LNSSTTPIAVVSIYNMPAVLILDDRYAQGDDAFVAVRVFRVPTEVPGSTRDLKYSLAYVVAGVCVLRFDGRQGRPLPPWRSGGALPLHLAGTAFGGLLDRRRQLEQVT
jgi:hypothetical protein